MTNWYTLTVRVGIEEPINQPGQGIERMGEPAVIVGGAIREMLGLSGELSIDTMYLIPEDNPKQTKRNRVIRTTDSLWDAAKVRADEKGETVSEAVRKFLERYVR